MSTSALDNIAMNAATTQPQQEEPGQDNALQNEPLPEYTTSWGPHLYRPKRLPEQYDTRIDPAHIFVFTVHPITGIERDFYVTPKPCDYCAKVRQICSRSRPQCQRCSVHAEGARACVVEEGWVRLPGPKCIKPKRKLAADGDATGVKRPKQAAVTAPNAAGAAQAQSVAARTRQSKPAKTQSQTDVAQTQLAEPSSAVLVQRSYETADVAEATTTNAVEASGSQSANLKSPPPPPRASTRYRLRSHIRPTAKTT